MNRTVSIMSLLMFGLLLGLAPMERARRQLSNEFSKRFWGLLRAEL